MAGQGKKLTVSDEEMLSLHKQGMSYAEIAEMYGIHLNTVGRHVKAAREAEAAKKSKPVKQAKPAEAPHGIKERKKPVKASTEDVLRLLKMGLSKQEIADALNVTTRTIDNHLAKLQEAEQPEEPEVMVTPTIYTPEPEPEPAPAPVTPPKTVKKLAPMPTDPFKFAICAGWIDKLRDLAGMAQPEPWGFAENSSEWKYPDVYILNTYINRIFTHRANLYNAANVEIADDIVYRRKDITCLHTGLYTDSYKGIYMVFTPNRNTASPINWFLVGFMPEGATELKFVKNLPKHIPYLVEKPGFNPEWPIRVNADHILYDDANRERLPEQVKSWFNLPLLLETAVEMARRKTFIEPGLALHTVYQGTTGFLLPLYLTNADKPDLAMAIDICDGYYNCRTCLTLKMAYNDVRAVGRPSAKWLTSITEESDDKWLL